MRTLKKALPFPDNRQTYYFVLPNAINSVNTRVDIVTVAT